MFLNLSSGIEFLDVAYTFLKKISGDILKNICTAKTAITKLIMSIEWEKMQKKHESISNIHDSS